MELTEEKAEERLNSSKNLLNKLGLSTNRTKNNSSKEDPEVKIVKLHNGGRNKGDKNIPQGIRELVSVAANVGTTKEAAESFGISHHQAFDYKQGKVNDQVNDKLVESRDKGLGKIHDKALEILMHSMGLITPKSMEGMKVKDVVDVAMKISTVVEKTRPESEREGNKPQVIIYAPRVKEENEFEVIEIEAQPA